jgi:hypothetical protein
MARRMLLVGVCVLFAQLASGCCWKCKHSTRAKHGFGHGAAVLDAPCGCSGSSPISGGPVVVSGTPVLAPVGPAAVAEPLPVPKKMQNAPNL